MKWKGRRGSANVNDRRGRRAPKAAGGGLVLIILALVVWFLGGDPRALLQQGMEQQQASAGAGRNPGATDPREDELVQFVSVILADTEAAWGGVFSRGGSRYQPPQLDIFTDRVMSACGSQSAAVGPFYCPGDRKVYLDLSFFEQLDRRFGAPGDFAQAYVVAHEVGHHVQNLLGIDQAARRLSSGRSRADANAISVLQELQADCFAGIWANHAASQRGFVERGDIREGLRAAAAIGDDAIQGQSGGVVRPESFTHGSSDQRVEWFTRGFETGDVGDCDSFAAAGVPLK